MLQHYFLGAWVANRRRQEQLLRQKARGRRLRRWLHRARSKRLRPERSGHFTSGFYAGPKDQARLEAIAPNLNLTVDYGFLWWMAVPLFQLLQVAAQRRRKLGCRDHSADADRQARAVSAVGRQLPIDGEHAPCRAADEASAGALRGRSAEAVAGNDGVLQKGKDQSARWLSADAAADAGVHRAVLGVV